MGTKEEYQLRLPVFEGPFDLLLHLIRENQVEISDIPIAEITAQYLDYLQAMEEMDLEIASSFVVMAATLLTIKARMLLPLPTVDGDEEGADARSELVHDLLEYLRFKEAAGEMSNLRALSSRRVTRPNEQELYLNLFSAENPLAGKTLADLQTAFDQVLRRAAARGEPILSIRREQVTLRDKLEQLFRLIQAQPQGVAFSAVFSSCSSRMEMIVTFLALLELARQRVIRVSQGQMFAEIYLYAGELENYDREAVV